MRSIVVQSLLGVLILSGGFTAELWAQPKKTATVWLGNLNQTCNGSPRSATATSNAGGISSFDFTYNGSAIAPTAAGSYNVACKLANANYQGSATGTLVISKASSTTTLTLSPPNARVGQTITLTATVKSTSNGVSSAGNVTFKDGDKAMKTVNLTTNNGVATATYSLNLTAGNHAFTAAYSGDTNFAGSTSAPAQ
jgi:hypothetical protein